MLVCGDFIANLVSLHMLEFPICRLGKCIISLPYGAPQPERAHFSVSVSSILM